eukprot:CAMPEP_0183750460 /NCGR_PEP_ID=MMETSP0739-20130205/1113_1 /TAXON_ID=385413 /ORGANISM="Thalassiosira miniscula, Strain CCMP1093" /LENGTH=387 /DNA_ID=CAMNT_0025986513 /DNA_START=347 /DNA_END=1510 /DNA_ORIENTATION=-
MTICPSVIDWHNQKEVLLAQECMKRGRSAEDIDLAPLEWMFDVNDVFIDRPEGESGDPLRVTLLKKQTSSEIANHPNAPLILFMHGGGFTVRAVKKIQSMLIFDELLKLDGDGTMMDSATFAMVEYRLAPEHAYPAATNDCLLALNHLVKEMGLGKGGVHVAGSSAGGTLAMETTLKALNIVDTFFVDEPVLPFPTTTTTVDNNKEVKWTMDSPSVRRYAYTRMPPVSWLEWSLRAYTGIETVSGEEDNLTLGTITTNVDITGGAMTASDWIQKRNDIDSTTLLPSIPLPRLILVTAMGDPLRNGGLAFKEVYAEALRKEKELLEQNYSKIAKGERMDGLPISKAKHFETYSGHVGFYLFERASFSLIMKEWYDEMYGVWQSRIRKQ